MSQERINVATTTTRETWRLCTTPHRRMRIAWSGSFFRRKEDIHTQIQQIISQTGQFPQPDRSMMHNMAHSSRLEQLRRVVVAREPSLHPAVLALVQLYPGGFGRRFVWRWDCSSLPFHACTAAPAARTRGLVGPREEFLLEPAGRRQTTRDVCISYVSVVMAVSRTILRQRLYASLHAQWCLPPNSRLRNFFSQEQKPCVTEKPVLHYTTQDTGYSLPCCILCQLPVISQFHNQNIHLKPRATTT